MEIVLTPLEEVKPFAANPYTHPRKQIEMLKKSIQEFGYTQPILINSDNMIIAGHARYQALEELGIAEIPTIKLDMPYEKAVRYVVADNRLSELAEPDTRAINEILQEAAKQDFDVEALGYNMDEVDRLLMQIQAHDMRYKPGVKSEAHRVEFIEDKETALTADDEATDIFSGKTAIVCYYSGGKDSSFALIWAKRNYPDKRIIAVFSDTSYEFPGMVSHIHKVCEHLGVEAQVVHPEIDIFHYWETKGRFFNMIFPECQSQLVFNPINAYVKRNFSPSEVVLIDGSRGDQVRRLTRKSKTSKGMDESMHIYDYYHPCHDVDYDLEKQIVEDSGIPIWEGYGQGFKRSACWCCPGMNGQQAYALEVNYPGLANVVRKMEKKLGMKLQSKTKGFDDLVRIGHDKALRRAAKEAAGVQEDEPETKDDKWINVFEDLSEEELQIYNREED